MKNLIPFILVVLFLVSMNASGQESAFAKAESLFKKEQYKSAKPLFESYLKSNRNDLKTLEYLGDIAGHAKDWDTAIAYYERLVELDGNVANYHYKYGGVMGMKALEINKLRAATMISDIKGAFLKAAELDPKHIETRWALVEFYIQLPGIIGGSEEKAIKYAAELSAISPVDGYLAKGYIAEYNDRPKDAERYYIAAVKEGGSMTCYTKLYEHYEKQGMSAEALATIQEAQEKHKSNNRLHYQLGKVAGQYGIGLDQGIECLNQYIALYSAKDGVPKDWAYLRLAQIYKHKGDKEKAEIWIDKALSSRSDFKEALAEKRIIQAL
ncbi:hypothetical protein EAX61_15875 [Dokdonia sinensis]|uniref:Tetratricopeptide repeat protein n=1 Tax=Dokdonia sinensis TaxID=2479847 RepID=A0A3M0G1N8_9FLAO|nr:tetratricopeptide repeat protein [Dokdonia sinensis]RMB56102.1 hypothetical protein EAX61_15875 [Dokdonia sinensis]